MGSLNRATLLGQLGADPELRAFGDTRIALLSVATSNSWTDKAGQKQESTQWHRVKVFDRQADFAENYLGKGDTVLVEGSIETRSYEDKQGIKRYVTEIRGQRVQSVRGKARDESRRDHTERTQIGTPSVASSYSTTNDDEVPF